MSEYEPVAAPEKTLSSSKKVKTGKVIGGVAVAGAAIGAIGYFVGKSKVIIPDSAVIDPPAVEPGERTRQKMERLVAQSLTPQAVAEMLTSTAAEVVRQLRSRALYGFCVDRKWRVPRFQFHRGRVVSGLESVLPKLDRNLHPIEVVNWFTLPNTDLWIDEETVSPIKWLQAGRDAGKVAELAEYVGSGL
jgi:hypothetical protein